MTKTTSTPRTIQELIDQTVAIGGEVTQTSDRRYEFKLPCRMVGGTVRKGPDMISYRDNVSVGDRVLDTWANESLQVTSVSWRPGRGWEARTERPSGHCGPTFYPHPDRMPDPDPNVYLS